MLVLRGESHVLPEGFLVRRLPQEPLILLSVATVPMCVGGLRSAGSTFRLDSSDQVYLLPGDTDVSGSQVDVVEGWLAMR